MNGYRLRISRDLALNKQLWERGLPGDEWCGDHHTFWVLWAPDGAAAGFCSAVKIAAEPGVFLSSAAVFRGHRGKRLQRLMISRRLSWARRQKAQYAVTYTVNGNWASAFNLLQSGFKAYDPQWSWAGKSWYFTKEL